MSRHIRRDEIKSVDESGPFMLPLGFFPGLKKVIETVLMPRNRFPVARMDRVNRFHQRTLTLGIDRFPTAVADWAGRGLKRFFVYFFIHPNAGLPFNFLVRYRGRTYINGHSLPTEVGVKTIVTLSCYSPTARRLMTAIRLLGLCLKHGGKGVEPVCFFCREPTIDAYIST
jgi:hypothetical protein